MICDERLQAAGCELVAEVVREAGWARLRVTGFSMMPAIWPGDELTVRGVDAGMLREGQVALYRREGKLTAHRVIEAARGPGEKVLTRGDSLPRMDAPVEAGEIVGQVVGIQRRGRAVKLETGRWQRGAAWVLRRSDGCTRLAMRWNGLARRWNGLASGVR